MTKDDIAGAGEALVLSTIDSSPYAFLQPTSQLQQASLSLAKRYIDPLAISISQLQQDKLAHARRKRKRGEADPYEPSKILRLKELHVDGFQIDQIWAQAKRALDVARLEIERSLDDILPITFRADSRNGVVQNGSRGDGGSSSDESQDDFAEGLNDPQLEDLDVNNFSDLDGAEDVQPESGIEDVEDMVEEGMSEIEDEGALEEEEEDELGRSSDSEERPRDVFVADKNGLNDGFFSIDDFNRQAQFLEQQDARGEDDGAASDEEDIDWATDPSSMPLPSTRDGEKPRSPEASDEEEEEDGPTFGNADLNGHDDSDMDDLEGDEMPMDGLGMISNTNDIKYGDFFAPPARKLTKSERRRALPKTQPPPREETEDDIQRTISAVRRDIFEDDLTASEGEASDTNGGNANQSSHQKRQAALTAEIRRLEAAALTKRDWQLSGEARASERPLNSLLEEDLDFERVGKPVPVITQEVSEDIESLIKRRILARDFDEVIRRRPGSLQTPTSTQQQQQRRGLLDSDRLSSSKPDKSLAEIYEDDHLRATDPSGHPDPQDKKLQAEQAAITTLWNEISHQLDALTSLHFRPKPPQVDINVVSDVPAIRMEDARPAGVEGLNSTTGTASRLAPQEIYRVGEHDDEENKTQAALSNGQRNDRERTEQQQVRTRGGLPIGKEEMTREEKKRRRRRKKERIRKAGGQPSTLNGARHKAAKGKGDNEAGGGAANGKSEKAQQNEDVVRDLKKGGVKVIGKKGEVRDIEGRKAVGGKGTKTGSGIGGGGGGGAGGYKL